MSGIIDTLLSKVGLKFEGNPGDPTVLNYDERDVLLNQWLPALSGKGLSVEDVKKYIQKMKESVEKDLVKLEMAHPSFWSFLFDRKKKERLLARLENYMLLEDFLASPERAKEAVERYIEELGKKRSKK